MSITTMATRFGRIDDLPQWIGVFDASTNIAGCHYAFANLKLRSTIGENELGL
jgi:hypothetical protein